jgi:hypothetical protein
MRWLSSDQSVCFGILDCDLAEIYGVEVRTLNQQVKRNPEPFPEDFSFTLSKGA